MAKYTSNFNNPYPNGWQDLPSEATPVDASALQKHTDTLESIDSFLNGMEQNAQENKIEKVTLNGTEQTISNKTVALTNIATTSDINNLKQDLSEVKEGSKNLFQREGTSGSAGGINYTFNADGSITASGTRTASTSYPIGTAKVKANKTYHISQIGNFNNVYFSIYSAIDGTSYTTGGVSLDITPTKDDILSIMLKGRANESTASGTAFIQLEEGTVQTAYEPYYEGTVELTQKANNRDLDMLGYIVPSESPIQNSVNGNQFVQNCDRIDLGTLNWTAHATTPNVYYFSNSVIGVKASGIGYILGGTQKTTASRCTANNDFYLGATNSGICRTDVSSASELATKLKGVYLYFEKETPITKTIDGNEAVTELKSNLNALIAELKSKGVID